MAALLELVGASHNLPFSVALAVVLILVVLQIVGAGDLLGADVDADADLDLDAGLLSVIGLGRMPFLMWLMLVLTVFALVGFAGQQLLEALTGGPLSGGLAALGAAVVALPLTGALSRPLARVIPRDETTAIAITALVGREAEIVIGTAAQGSPARARVRDHHGQDHYVMVEPHDPAERFAQGERVLLVRQERDVFWAMSRNGSRLLQAD